MQTCRFFHCRGLRYYSWYKEKGSLGAGKDWLAYKMEAQETVNTKIAGRTSEMGQMLRVSKIHRSRGNDGATLTYLCFMVASVMSPSSREGYEITSIKLPQSLYCPLLFPIKQLQDPNWPQRDLDIDSNTSLVLLPFVLPPGPLNSHGRRLSSSKDPGFLYYYSST
jgi:hypothetical protein